MARKREQMPKQTAAAIARGTGVFQQNVRALIDLAGRDVSLAERTERAGIARRSLWNAANSSHSPTLSKVLGIAHAFDIEPWRLLHEDLTAELLVDPYLTRVVRGYVKANEDGRKNLVRVAEAEERLGRTGS